MALLIALTTGPALVVGTGLWLLADLMPQCAPEVHESVTSPDGTATLAVFSLDCGAADGSNTQAAVHSAAEPFSQENAQVFFVAEGTHDLSPRWREDGSIVIDAPAGAAITRQLDRVGSSAVVYD
ncbi:hypothetical protein [Devosia geojensis]|uniref:hypothetical protein n=1 Tax=Devosia geojensis TaxID=443610 RepID=UPI00128BCD6D|nr:hypothetical protein [Devosia geojensis]